MSAPAFRTRSRFMANRGSEYVLGEHLRNIRTPQDLQAFERQVQREMNEAFANIQDPQYSSTPRRNGYQRDNYRREGYQRDDGRGRDQSQDVRQQDGHQGADRSGDGYHQGSYQRDRRQGGDHLGDDRQGGDRRGDGYQQGNYQHNYRDNHRNNQQDSRQVHFGGPRYGGPRFGGPRPSFGPDQRSQPRPNTSHPTRLPVPQTPSMQWDNGAHNGNPFVSSENSSGRARQGSAGLPNLDNLSLHQPGDSNHGETSHVSQGPHRHGSTNNLNRTGQSQNQSHSNNFNNPVNRSVLESTRDRDRNHTHNDQSRHSDPLLTESDHERMDRCFSFYASRNNNRGSGSNEGFDPFRVDQPPSPHPQRNNNNHSNHTNHANISNSVPTGPVAWQFRGPELKPPRFSGNEVDYQEWKLAFRAQVDSYPEELRVATLRDYLDEHSRNFIAYIPSTDPDAYYQCFQALDLRCGGTVAPQHLYTGKLLELLSGPQAHNLLDLERVYNILNYAYSKLRQTGHESYAEPMLLGLSNILFGKSQSDVDKLSTTNRLSVPNVLDAIWNHMTILRTREQNNRLTRHSESPSQPGSGRMFLTSVNGHVPPVPSGTANAKQPHSPVRGQNSSGFYRSSRQTPGQSGPRNRNQSRSNSSSRSQSPDRRQKVFMCQLCEVNDHSHTTCTTFSIEQQFQMCRDKRLCFICKSAGHGARICPHQNLRCSTPSCSTSPPHNNAFCDFAKPQ